MNKMKTKILLEKAKFDATLSALLKAKPIERKRIKTSGKQGPKTPILAKQ